MENYNAPKDSGYAVATSYVSVNTSENTYGGFQNQDVRSSLPMYQGPQKEQSIPRISRCPNGAQLGKIGSACGTKCSRACAVQG
jgi:hypothetical protein